MHEHDTPHEPDEPFISEAFTFDNDDEPPPNPLLRRAFRIAYIVIVILVIAGLILMLFPWRSQSVPFPVDLPWQTIRIILPSP